MKIKMESKKFNRLGKEVSFEILEDIINQLHSEKIRLGNAFPKIGILIISYNASILLKQTIERIPLGLIEVIDQIFVFDDASKDDTFEIGLELQKTSPWKEKLKVFKNPKNQGYGGNQKVGFRYGIDHGMDAIVMLHGDGQYAPEHLPELIAPIVFQNAGVVFGSRMINRMDALKGGMPLYKWVGNQVLTKFENLIIGIKLAEYHTGYRVYKTEVLDRIPFEENTNDFHFDSEIIVQVRALDVQIHEVPIKTFYGEEVCHVNGLKYAMDVCRTVLEYRLHQLHVIRKSKYLVRHDVIYTRKTSPYGSHEQILRLINRPGKAILFEPHPSLLTDSLSANDIDLYNDKILDKTETTSKNVIHQIDSTIEPNFKPLKREYDYIIMADFIQRNKNAQKLLRQVRVLLKPDGYLIVSTPNIANWFYRLSLLFGRFAYGPKGILDENHVHLYTLPTFRQLIERSGYRITNETFTSLPFEVVFESNRKSHIIRLFDWFYYQLVCFWPKLFAYQMIIEAEITSLE